MNTIQCLFKCSPQFDILFPHLLHAIAADIIGLGQRSLKHSGRIAQVFMHTSATPAPGNPNPTGGSGTGSVNLASAGSRVNPHRFETRS